MAYNHPHSYKAYSDNNRTSLSFTILIYSLVQKLLSNGFLMLLWGNCFLCTVVFSCNLKTKGLQNATHAAAPPNSGSRCIGTITTLGMGDPIKGWMMVDLDPLYKKRKWKQILSKVRLLHDKGPIQNLIIAYDGHSSVRFKRIDAEANLSAHVAATNPIDEAIPNWKDCGITPFMLCQRSNFGNKPIFSLDLNGVTFQNREQLGFILVQNNSSPVDLVQYLVEKEIPWPDGPDTYTPIKDYLILPGAIGNYILQSKPSFDAMIDLDSYTTIYCYVKRGHHYCFIPLDLLRNSIAQWQFYGLPSSNRAEHPDVSPKNCASQTILPPYTSSKVATNPLSLKENNGLTQETPNVATSEMAQSPKSNMITRKPITPSDLGYDELNKKIKEEEKYQKILPEVLKFIRTFKNNQDSIVTFIEGIKSIASNDGVKNKIRPSSVNEIESAVSSASKAIKSLKSALEPKEGYQQDMTYSRPTNLSNKRIAVIQALKNLEKSVHEEYKEFVSVANALTPLIEYLEETCYILLFNLFSDEIDSIEHSVKQLFIGDNRQFKKAQKIIIQLEKIVSDQRNVVRNFIKKASEMEEILVSIQKDLVTLIGYLKKEIVRPTIDLLDLKNKLRLDVNIIEGKVKNPKYIEGIIKDLESTEEDMETILNSVDLKTKKIEIAKKIEEAVNNALNLEKKFKINMRSKSEEIFKQIEVLKEPLLKMKEMYNELCQDDILD